MEEPAEEGEGRAVQGKGWQRGEETRPSAAGCRGGGGVPACWPSGGGSSGQDGDRKHHNSGSG